MACGVPGRATHGYMDTLGYFQMCSIADTGYYGYLCIAHTQYCTYLHRYSIADTGYCIADTGYTHTVAESGPIGVRIEASALVCAVAPHELDH
jgi:hypothetical protein